MQANMVELGNRHKAERGAPASGQPEAGSAPIGMAPQAFASVFGDELPADARLAEWQQFLSTNRAHFFQGPSWFRCLAARGQSRILLTLADDRVVASSVIRRRIVPLVGLSIFVVERGPVCADAAVLTAHLQQLVQALRDQAIVIRISPFQVDVAATAVESVLSECGWKPVGDKSHMYDATVVVDLRRDMATIRGDLRRSLRTQLNKAERLAVRIRHDTGPQEIRQFVDAFNAMAARRGLAPITREMADEFARIIDQPDGVRLFVCEYEQAMVAGALLIPAGDRVIYRWGYSSESPAHRALPLSHLLHWEAIRWARDAGYAYYDFGGYWMQRGDSDPINRFKTGFSKDIQRLVREHAMIIRPAHAAALTGAARIRSWIPTFAGN